MNKDPEALVGRNLGGRFRLDALVAQYPYGVVYDARDLRLDRAVTVQLLIGVPPPGQSFEREARRVRALHNTLIARLYASVRLNDGTAGLVMESMAGETLLERLKRGVFTIEEALHVLDGLLQALIACHAAGVVHRDVRPNNILLDYSADDPHHPEVKLHGAGLAQLIDEHASSTIGGVLYGHPLFTAPEQWVNRSLDARTDMYAVALLGYVMLLGKHFIRPGSPLAVCQQHFKATRPSLKRTARGETITPALNIALSKAARPRPEDRFKSAEAMRAALATARAEIPTRPPLPRPPTGPLPDPLPSPTVPMRIESGDLERITAELAAAFDE